MALHFDSSAGNTHVGCGSDSSIDDFTSCSVVVIARLTETAHASLPRIFSKMASGVGKNTVFHDGSIWSGVGLRIFVNRAVTLSEARADFVPTVDTWYCIVFTYDESDGPRIFHGAMDGSVVAEDAYTGNGIRTVGSGATTAEASATLRWGNRSDTQSDNNGMRGDIARAAYYDTNLSLGDVRRLQYAPLGHWNLASCKDLHEFGFNGTGSQPDYSGTGNSGTVTNATETGHPGIRVMPGGVRIVPFTSGGPVSNDRLADMAFAKGRLPWGFGRLPTPDGTIG